MHELLIEYMEQALEFEESGFIESAVVLYNKLLDLFPEETATILTEKAKMEFRNMLDKEALMDFIHAYTIEQDEELYHLILEAYLNPNKEMLQTKYQVNMALIQRYPFYWNDYNKDELDAYVLWSDESVICMVNLAEKAFGILQRRERMEQHQEEASFMMTDQLWESDILYYKEQMKLSRPLMDLELPYYLVYNKFFWQIFTQIAEIPELLLENRAVFLIGEQSLQN